MPCTKLELINTYGKEAGREGWKEGKKGKEGERKWEERDLKKIQVYH